MVMQASGKLQKWGIYRSQSPLLPFYLLNFTVLQFYSFKPTAPGSSPVGVEAVDVLERS